jgi:nitrogen fixation NifU-like protein
MRYSKKTLNYFMHPKNTGKIEDADGIGKVGNPYCGDVLWLYIKIKKGKLAD